MTPKGKNRRGFLGHMAVAAAAASLPITRLHAAPPAVPQGGQDDWLSEVGGSHKCFFDFPQHKNGFGLLHVLNYINTYGQAYNVAPTDIGTVGTFYSVGAGCSLQMGFDDFVWNKYALGEYSGLRDANGRPYTRNVFNSPTEADGHLLWNAFDGPELPMLGGALVAGSIASLQSMGTKFLMCNNALNLWTFELAARGKGTQEAINAELRDHVLPGVTIVPAMVIAIEKAQAAGITYNKQ